MASQFKARVVQFMLHAFATMPLPLARYLGGFLGVLAYYSGVRAAKTTSVNIHVCFPELTPSQVKRATRLSMAHAGKMAAEMGMSWLWPSQRVLGCVHRIEGQTLLEQAVQSDKGLIVISPHLGNWEVMGIYLASQTPTAALYQPPKMAIVDPMIKSARSRNGSELVPTNTKGVIRLLKRLKAGGVVGILPDQEPDPESGVFVHFYNYPALTMTLVSKLSAKTRDPV